MAAGCGVLLHCLGVQRALLGLTVFYAIAAIAPWLVVLRHISWSVLPEKSDDEHRCSSNAYRPFLRNGR